MSSPSSSAKPAAEDGPSAASPASRLPAAGTAAFNTLVTCILIAILLSTGMTYYFRVIRLAREVALRYELANMRTAIVLFAALNHRLPGSLRELVDTKYLLPDEEFSIATARISVEKRTIFKRSYLEPSSIDMQGRVLDPFGIPYRFDPQRGQVTATEERYRQW